MHVLFFALCYEVSGVFGGRVLVGDGVDQEAQSLRLLPVIFGNSVLMGPTFMDIRQIVEINI